MNTTTVRTRFVLILALLVFATFAATSSTLACVVGTGTSASCTEAALDACLPGGGSFDGTVTFACGGAATITVTSAKTISADTTIDGGSVITISGSGNAVGVLSVNSGVTFTVENLTVANGHTRGAITNGGTLTVTNCTFSGNSATFRGGAIRNPGSLTVTNSTFSGNSATLGGAISNEGTLTVTNSILANSTSGGNCGVPAGITAIFTDGGHNIDDGTTCGFTGTTCASTTGTSFCNTNPLLDPAGLASNGGPTQTIALEAGSPAINAGDETVCAAPPVNNLDQRGFVRPGMGATRCSIGAYEFNATTSTTATTTSTTTSTTSTTTTHVPTTTTSSTTTSTSTTIRPTTTMSSTTTTTRRAPTTTTTSTTTTIHVTTTTTCPNTCINPGVGSAGSCTVLELAAGEGAVKVAVAGGPGGIDGDVCIGPNGNLSITGAQFVTGNVRLASGATLRKTGPGSIGGVLRDQDLDEEITDAMSAATDAAALPCTQMFASLNASQVIVGAGGENVLCVGDVILNGGRVVTLSGGASDTFIVNVTGRFALTGASKIVASGVPPSAVLYNIIGNGPAVALSGMASIDGTILAVERDIALTPAIVNGEVIGGQKMSITSNASVRCPSCPVP